MLVSQLRKDGHGHADLSRCVNKELSRPLWRNQRDDIHLSAARLYCATKEAARRQTRQDYWIISLVVVVPRGSVGTWSAPWRRWASPARTARCETLVHADTYPHRRLSIQKHSPVLLRFLLRRVSFPRFNQWLFDSDHHWSDMIVLPEGQVHEVRHLLGAEPAIEPGASTRSGLTAAVSVGNPCCSCKLPAWLSTGSAAANQRMADVHYTAWLRLSVCLQASRRGPSQPRLWWEDRAPAAAVG